MAERRVLVTGASRGIGRDLALGFATEGATVVITARHVDDLADVAEAISDRGAVPMAVACDVTQAEQVQALRRRVASEMGGVDVLINNAGAAASHKFLTHPDDLWDEMIAVNLTGVYYITKAFAGSMVEAGWGRIINIASTAARVGGKYVAAYTAAKHGVLGLTRALAIELAPGVTVNAICPGYVDTPMTERTLANIISRTGMAESDALAALTGHTAQGRLIQPAEITAFALYLASDAAAGLTGQAITIDGGGVMS